MPKTWHKTRVATQPAFGQWLRKKRIIAGLSTIAAARACGISNTYFNFIEINSHPNRVITQDTIERIESFFGRAP